MCIERRHWKQRRSPTGRDADNFPGWLSCDELQVHDTIDGQYVMRRVPGRWKRLVPGRFWRSAGL